jgi:hypothetical protein
MGFPVDVRTSIDKVKNCGQESYIRVERGGGLRVKGLVS